MAIAQNRGESAEAGIQLERHWGLNSGRKIAFEGDGGIRIVAGDGDRSGLARRFLIGDIDPAGNEMALIDAIYRKPVMSVGEFRPTTAEVTSYRLVGPMYFLFLRRWWCTAMAFVFVAGSYR